MSTRAKAANQDHEAGVDDALPAKSLSLSVTESQVRSDGFRLNVTVTNWTEA